MTIKALRKDIFLYQQTDSTIKMPRLVDINLSPIDLTGAIFYANFTNSITSQTFYPIVVTTDMNPANGLYFLNFTQLLTDLPAACYIYNVDALINSSKTPISFGNLIISRNVSVVPPPITTYSIVNDVCVLDASGIYISLAECELALPPTP